ncbi:MAG: flagellar motor protein MotB [Syntrophobacteraceae bacterium]|nr:flagellar motor protein MotB [Syntrophobacteraceae bacterium]
MDEGKVKKIIIKKVKKGHGEGHHGGSWKVAYADFVTAMMAFFLLMWLLNMTSSEKRAVLAMYFRHFSLFTQGGTSFMQKGGIRPVGENVGSQEVVDVGENSSGVTNDELGKRLMTGVSESPNGPAVKKQVFIEVTTEGVRIQIVDSSKNPIFEPGSAEITALGKQIIGTVVTVLKNFPNKIAVEGHTDSTAPGEGQMSNWELSVARALSARRELESEGINPIRICRVVGFADREPLFPIDDPRNRRISILFCKSLHQKPPDNLQWLLKPAK